MARKKLHKASPKEQSIRFDVGKTINYWLEGADYDIGVAEAMYEKGKYPYALFMGHLAIEKLLKALVVKNTGEHAPFSHSLPFLLEKTGISEGGEKPRKVYGVSF